MSVHMLAGNHVLRFLGLDPGRFLSQLENFHSQQTDMLQQMRDGFNYAAGFTAATQLASMLQSGVIPGAGSVGAPNMGNCNCGNMYAQPRTMDFGAMPGAFPFSFPALMQRQRGAMFERMLQQNPFIRQQVEMMMGGRIMPDGMADGRMSITPFPPGMMSPGGTPNPAAMGVMDAMNQVMQAASTMGPASPFGMFNQMMLGALSNVVNNMMNGGQNGGAAGAAGNPLANLFGPPLQQQPANPSQGTFGLGGGGDTSSILNDSSLTVEDKVTLMLMLIMKKMDKDIEKQMNHINQLQQQQNGGIGQQGGSAPSIDVETMKLKRLIDKRGQMFDMLRQIIDKYNETAKNIIQSMGR